MIVVVAGRVVNRSVRMGADGVPVAVGEVETPAGLFVCGVRDRHEVQGPEVGRWGFFSVLGFLGRKEGAVYVVGDWLPKAPDLVAMASDAILAAS
jgi:hypothetical protein